MTSFKTEETSQGIEHEIFQSLEQHFNHSTTDPFNTFFIRSNHYHLFKIKWNQFPQHTSVHNHKNILFFTFFSLEWLIGQILNEFSKCLKLTDEKMPWVFNDTIQVIKRFHSKQFFSSVTNFDDNEQYFLFLYFENVFRPSTMTSS